MHFLLAAAAPSQEWDLPFCRGSEHWFCNTDQIPGLSDLLTLGINPSHVVIMLIPFWITVIVVSRLVVKPLLQVLEEREKRTAGARAEAADFEKRFNEKLTAYEARLAETRLKASEERARIRAATAVEVEKILSAAREDASKAVDQVRLGIDAERKKASEDLKKQSETLAAELASKALGRDLGTTPTKGRPPVSRSEGVRS